MCIHSRSIESRLLTVQEEDTPSLKEHGNGYIVSTKKLQFLFQAYVSHHSDARSDFRVRPMAAKSLSGLPPTLVLTATLDALRDEGAAYAQALCHAGVPCEHHSYQTCHAFLTARIPESRRALDVIIRFVKTHSSPSG